MWNAIVTGLHKTFYGDRNGDIPLRNLEGDTPLHCAIKSFDGDIGFIKTLLERDKKQVNVRDLKGESPLYLAVQNTKCTGELIGLLLQHGAEVNATTVRDGNTALHWLAKGDMIEFRFDVAQSLMISRYIRFNVPNLEGDTPLHYAMRSFDGDIGFINFLLVHDRSQLNVRNLKDETPHYLALQNKRCSSELIRLLLEYGADVNATIARDGNTALHWIAKDNMIEYSYNVGQTLLRHDSVFNVRNLVGDTPLHFAIRSLEGDIGFIKALLVHDKNLVNARNLNDESPLHLAVQHEKCSDHLIKLLLEHGADVKATTARDGNTALHWLAKGDMIESGYITVDGGVYVNGSYRIARMLLEHGSDANARNLEGDTPLHLAVQRNGSLFTQVEELLEHGSDVNASNFKGDTPLHLNVKTQVHCLDKFLDKITDVNVVNSKGETPLHLAVQNEKCAQVYCIKLLLDRGADVNKKDAMGKNVYQAYCHAVHTDKNRTANPMLEVLLQSHVTQQKDLSLRVACLNYRADWVHRLLKKGADANAMDTLGSVPLFYAFITPEDVEKYSIVKLLLDFGADITQNFNISVVDANSRDTSFYRYVTLQFSLVFCNTRIMQNVFFEHIAKLLALYELQVQKVSLVKVLSQQNYNCFRAYAYVARQCTREYTEGYDYWCYCCSEELKTMSVTKIGKSRVSFLDLLLADAEETANINTNNKELVMAFHAKKAMFPMYRGMLDAKIDGDIERKELVGKATVALINAWEFAVPTDEFYERTLSYCSNNDLANLIEAVEGNIE